VRTWPGARVGPVERWLPEQWLAQTIVGELLLGGGPEHADDEAESRLPRLVALV
jgi:hypothetical protein